MTVACSLTGIPSWFVCVQTTFPFAELLSVAIAIIFFTMFKEFPLREALPASLFIGTFSAFVFAGLGVIGLTFPIGMLVLLGLSVIFLNAQNG